MKNHQSSIQTMFGELVMGMRRIASVHDLKDEVVGDIAGVLVDLFTTYVEPGRTNHHRSIPAMFRELAVGMREIVQVHDLKDEAVQDIAGLLEELLDTYVRRRRWRNNHQAMHAMARALVVGMCEFVDAHDLGDEVVSHLAEVVDGLLETNLAFCRARQASVQELLDELFAISEEESDEEQPSGRELLDDLLAMHLERCRKEQNPRRRGLHPAMAELLVRLDRLGTDHDDAEDAASTAAN